MHELFSVAAETTYHAKKFHVREDQNLIIRYLCYLVQFVWVQTPPVVL